RIPAVGELLRRPDLARTFERMIAAEARVPGRVAGIQAARDLLYRGEIAQEIARFCEVNYGVSFPMFEKSGVAEGRAGSDLALETADGVLVRDDLAETPVKNPTTTTDARKGALYADSSLRDLVGQLRQLVSDPVAGLAADRDELAEIGISTGATTGSGTINPNAVAGRLTFDEAKFDAALDADPLGVQKLVGAVAGSDGFAQRLDTTLAAWAGPGGVFDQRQTSISSEISTIQNRMAAIDRRLELREQQLRAQFTAMEEALQAVQAQGSWLQAQLAGMLRSS
ncbi:MAG: flagellar filament capping protein FliD, partial [Thermoleophilum sp.]|nr:flagellar filament capping protein FliD [Thermoleophilum sp.]